MAGEGMTLFDIAANARCACGSLKVRMEFFCPRCSAIVPDHMIVQIRIELPDTALKRYREAVAIIQQHGAHVRQARLPEARL